MARRDRQLFVLWNGFSLFFFLFIAYTFFAGRYLNPILPSLAAAAGIAVAAIQSRFGWRVAALAALVACIQPLYRDVQVDRLFGGKDTRTLARERIGNELPDGARVALQSYSVPVPQSAESVRESLARNGALDELGRQGKYFHMLSVAEKSHPTYDLVFLGNGEERNRTYLDYREVVAEELNPLFDGDADAVTVVLRYPPGPIPAPVEAFFDRVRQRGTELARITPFRENEAERHPYLDNEDWPARAGLSNKGPLIEIWSLEKP